MDLIFVFVRTTTISPSPYLQTQYISRSFVCLPCSGGYAFYNLVILKEHGFVKLQFRLVFALIPFLLFPLHCDFYSSACLSVKLFSQTVSLGCDFLFSLIILSLLMDVGTPIIFVWFIPRNNRTGYDALFYLWNLCDSMSVTIMSTNL